jgi:hypothetical protein
LHHTHSRSLVSFLIDDKNLEVSYVNHSLVKHVLEAGSACAWEFAHLIEEPRTYASDGFIY